MRSILFLAFGLLTSTTAVFSQTSIRMTVNEESKPCRRMMEQTCLQVQKDGSTEWELFYDNIKGFDFEPGYRYEIIVIQTLRPEPVPQDLSKYLYKLDKVISKTAVSDSRSGDMIPQPQLWKVISLNGIQLNTEELYFGFSEDGTQISGKSGCNGFSTPISFNKKKTKLTTKSGIGTLIACSEELTKLENEFLASISNKKFKLQEKDGKKIWKRKGKEVLVLEAFVRIPQMIVDPAPLADKTPWDYFNGKTLKVIQLNGQSATDSKAHLIFDTKAGRITGNNGCNQLFGSFTTNDRSIAFSGIGSTKMACTDEKVSATERSIMAILGSEGLTVDFAEQVMNIYDTSGKLVLMLAVEGK